MEHFVNEYVEIHVLHRPGHLAREAEDGQRQPEPAVMFDFFHKINPLSASFFR